MLNYIINLPRIVKQLVLMFLDSILIILVLLTSFAIRNGYWTIPSNEKGSLALLIFCVPLFAIPIFIKYGLYRTIIRFMGLNALWVIVQSVALYSLILGLILFMTDILGFPRAVIIINWLLATIVFGGSRLLLMWILNELSIKSNLVYKNVVIYGAGSAGRQLSIALAHSNEYNPIALIDDNSSIHGKSIKGLEVVSPINLDALIEENNVTEIFLAIPSVSRKRRNEIINFLAPYPALVRSLPGVSELAQGKIQISDLYEISIEDLLGRASVPATANNKLLSLNIKDKVVLVTGAGGSIGSELCRQIVFLKPKKLILYDISESSLYLIDQELIDINMRDIEIFPVIGSIADKHRLNDINNYYGVQTIYHAAAYKHVPLVEYNKSQGILNNVIGTLRVAEAAILGNVETFVLISTDKAVRPTSIMGASKRVAELILQALNKEHSNICFTMVRFGNVLNSSGSVIPLFKKQIKAGGPVTVTHSDIVRYFMTIPEAVELVIQAGAMAKGGEVFVLDMGEPIRINDLAEKMIKLSGLEVLDNNNPNGDIEIQYTGLRPGEKLYEELLVNGNFSFTENKLIMCAKEEMLSWDKLEPVLAQIEEFAKNDETKEIYKLLSQLVPEYNPIFNDLDKLRIDN